jgi:superfamily I DNA/RNA helicase
LQEEAQHVAQQLRIYHEQGRPWNDMAVLYPARFVAEEVVKQLQAAEIPVEWLQESSSSRRFKPAEISVKVMTMYSSKGLEFPIVAIAGVGFMPYMEDQEKEDAKLLYVGMTRATERLILTAHKHSDFVQRLLGHGAASTSAAGGSSTWKMAAG